jgi:hypothetical protein
MNVYFGFLVLVTLIGGMGAGRHLRRRPILLLALSTIIAASFYSLRVTL